MGDLTGERLFGSATDVAVFGKVLEGVVTRPTSLRPDLPPNVDAVVLRALARDPSHRFATALEMAAALEDALPPAPSRAVGEWVDTVARPVLAERARRLARVEAGDAAAPHRAPRVSNAPGASADGTATDTASAPPPRFDSARPPPDARVGPSASAAEQASGSRLQASAHPSATPPAWSSSDMPRLPTAGATNGESVPRAPARSTTLTMPVVASSLSGAPAASTAAVAAGPIAPAVGAPATTPPRRGGAPWMIAAAVAGVVAVAFAASTRAPLVLTQARAGIGVATGRALAAATTLATRTPASDDASAVGDPEIVVEPVGAAPRRAPSPAHSVGSQPSASASSHALPNCNPPTYEDETGIRRVKRECL